MELRGRDMDSDSDVSARIYWDERGQGTGPDVDLLRYAGGVGDGAVPFTQAVCEACSSSSDSSERWQRQQSRHPQWRCWECTFVGAEVDLQENSGAMLLSISLSCSCAWHLNVLVLRQADMCQKTRSSQEAVFALSATSSA